MNRTLCMLLTLAAVALSAAASARAAAQPPSATRADLAIAYLRFERALAAHAPTGDELARISRRFDVATSTFIGGGAGPIIRDLHALTTSLLPADPSASQQAQRRIAESMRASVEPLVFVRGSTVAPQLRLDRLYEPSPTPVDDGMPRPITLDVAITPVGDAGPPIATIAVALDDPSVLPPPRPLAADLGALPTGAYEVRVAPERGEARTTARWFVVDESLDAVRARNDARIDALASAPDAARLAGAIGAVRARNALLTDTPSLWDSAQFMADLAALPRAVERELAAIEAGENPYRDHPGDLWRTVSIADAAIPVRIYNPPRRSGSAAPTALRPLVIVLHGIGGDESMFMDAYGAGIIKDLADEHGFVVVSPRNTPFAGDPIFFDDLIGAVAADYPIDPERVYLVGHSMGAGIAMAWARQRPGAIAAAVCIAGFPPPRALADGGSMPPVFVIASELDRIMPASGVQPAAEAAIAAGLPIEFRLIPHHGHTTVVGEVLPGVIPWLLGHRLDEP